MKNDGLLQEILSAFHMKRTIRWWYVQRYVNEPSRFQRMFFYSSMARRIRRWWYWRSWMEYPK